MKLRTKFLLFIILLHSVAVVLSFFIFKQNKLLFIASEVLIIISIGVCLQLYNQLIQPLNLLIQGADAIKERDFNVRMALTGKFEIDTLIRVYNQMIDELRKERTHQEQQHFFLEKLIATSPTGILVLDYDGNIQNVNQMAEELLAIQESDVAGKPVDAIQHPLGGEIKKMIPGEAKTVTFNGINVYKLQKSHFIDRGFSRDFIIIEELTEEILAAEKKAYGKVIRMMAHEVNNTIGPVNSILQSALSSGGIWEVASNQNLQAALQVAYERNNNLSIFMRNFADVVRLPPPQKTTIDLHKLIQSLSKFIELMAGQKNIQFEYRFSSRPFNILADQQQMEQVIINVVKNSIEAIDNTGIISFTTNERSRELIVTDNGRGIDKQYSNQIFSSFFSTKKDGQGIGLTLVKDILINHGFEFSLFSTPDGHTQFVFKFRE